jgi:nucleotide-binding universal stress UspA family protein
VSSTGLGRIVVGVDGSAASLAALRWATKQATLTGDAIEAVITWQVPTQYGSDFYGSSIDWADIAQRTIEDAVKEASDGSPWAGTQSIEQGEPAHVLVAASADANLVVVGSRGHGGFAGLLLGSVSEYVIAHAACPVVVIRDQRSSE